MTSRTTDPASGQNGEGVQAESGQRILFLMLLGAFFITRLLVLLTGVESASDLEELCRGTLAYELVSGLKFPFWNYQADTYSGGSLVIGLLAAPFFKIMGPSLLALKMAPLFFSFLTLLAAWFWIRREGGAGAGPPCMAFLVFCPPVFLQVSLLAMGFHSESLLFSALTLLFFYRWRETGRAVHLGLCGFAGGLGFWFCYTSALALAACAVCFILTKRENKIRDAGFFYGGFLQGAVLFFIYNAMHGWAGAKFLARSFMPDETQGSAFLETVARKTAGLVFYGAPLSLGLGFAAGVLYCLLALGLLAAQAAGKKNQKPLAPVFLTLALFLGFYGASGFVFQPGSYIDYRYFVIFHFPALVVLGVCASRNRAAAFLGAVLLLMGFWGQAQLWFKEPFASAARYRGYSYYQMGWVWGPLLSSEEGRRKVFSKLAEYPEKDRFFLIWGLSYAAKPAELDTEIFRPFLPEAYGLAAARDLKAPRGLPENLKILPQAEEKFQRGLSSAVYFNGPGYLPEYLQSFTPGQESYFNESLGGYFYVSGGFGMEELKSIMETERARDFVRGAGREAGSAWVYDRLDILSALSKLQLDVPELLEPALFEGLGWSLRRELAEDRTRALDWAGRLPGKYRAYAVKGIEECEAWYGIKN